jgi:hypothetical protein
MPTPTSEPSLYAAKFEAEGGRCTPTRLQAGRAALQANRVAHAEGRSQLPSPARINADQLPWLVWFLKVAAGTSLDRSARVTAFREELQKRLDTPAGGARTDLQRFSDSGIVSTSTSPSFHRWSACTHDVNVALDMLSCPVAARMIGTHYLSVDCPGGGACPSGSSLLMRADGPGQTARHVCVPMLEERSRLARAEGAVDTSPAPTRCSPNDRGRPPAGGRVREDGGVPGHARDGAGGRDGGGGLSER